VLLDVPGLTNFKSPNVGNAHTLPASVYGHFSINNTFFFTDFSFFHLEKAQAQLTGKVSNLYSLSVIGFDNYCDNAPF
jgi:hypothetical protein